MALQLKTKIALGGLFLFVLLITVAAVSFFYFNKINQEARAIIKDNYETLSFSKEMLRELDIYKNAVDKLQGFEKNLQQQENNITEPGEQQLTVSLRKNFELLKKKGNPDSLALLLRKDINEVMALNLQAIDSKNQAAQASAKKARTIVTVCLTICLLLGFTFIFNFPAMVAAPLAKLTAAIRSITNKQYSERIHLNRKDEFGELADAFNTMAERLDQYEHSNLARIIFEKSRAEAVINSLKDASIGIDKNGLVLFANQQALQLLNLKEQDIVGLQQEEVKKRNDLFRYLQNEQNTIPFRIIIDGKENFFFKEVVELTHEGQHSGFVIILKNITPFKELDAAKTNFIATISHELKTPLASSDFSLKLLNDERVGPLTPEQKELIKSLKDDNKRLLRILSELLDLTQVESGKIRLELLPAEPLLLIEKAIDSVQNAAREKNITIQKIIPGNLPQVCADADKTIWVLNNFLTNAIRYSENNSIVTIAAAPQGNAVEFSVQDSGKGIDPQYKDKIFDRYFKIPGTQEGTGLGLSICREFIDAQSGQIQVESSIGKGSCFSFIIPAVTA